jgi:hypothetical protein
MVSPDRQCSVRQVLGYTSPWISCKGRLMKATRRLLHQAEVNFLPLIESENTQRNSMNSLVRIFGIYVRRVLVHLQPALKKCGLTILQPLLAAMLFLSGRRKEVDSPFPPLVQWSDIRTANQVSDTPQLNCQKIFRREFWVSA